MGRTKFAMVGLIAAGSLGVALAAPANADTSALPAPPLTVTQAGLHLWRTGIEGVVDGSPSTFTGLSLDPATGTYQVSVAPGTDLNAAAASVSSATAGATTSLLATGTSAPRVTFVVASQSHEQQLAVMSRITDAVSAHLAIAEGIVSWSPDPVTGGINIGVLSSASSRADEIAAYFGPHVTTSPSGTAVLTSRVADSAPWYGGDRIYNSSGTGCSSGLGVKSGSTYYELTAGHCGPIGSTWKVGTSYSSGTTLGTLSKRDDTNNGPDVAAITASGSAAGRIWSGCLTCSSSMAIKGQINAVVGEALCWDGSVSLFVCGTNVTAVDECIYFADVSLTHCGLTEARNSNGIYISVPGDSGGPVVYNLGSGNAYAAGTIVGFHSSYAYGLYEPLKYSLPALGVSLVTG